MKIENPSIFPKLVSICRELETEFGLIPTQRIEKLLALRDYIAEKLADNETPKLLVICTHNSRRSHLAQIWLALGADYYQLPEIRTFSGGTEATAFNIRAVNALRRAGFEISQTENDQENPVYLIRWKKDMQAYQAFSKEYDSDPNPGDQFAAIMVCSEADEGCPVVFGSDFRLSLPYQDPKEFDGTELEEMKYDERVRQIGREMLYLLSQIHPG